MTEFLRFFRHALAMLRHVLGVVLVLFGALLFCAVVVGLAEGMPIGEALYFTLITGMTIGYGDITPTTITGRVLSILMGAIGLVFFGIIVAVSNRALAETVREASSEQQKNK